MLGGFAKTLKKNFATKNDSTLLKTIVKVKTMKTTKLNIERSFIFYSAITVFKLKFYFL